MAIYRNVCMSFWTDSKVVDDFSPEDKYFYLYLFTNPHTNLCGCYEISVKQMAYETGYDQKKINNLIKRLSEEHNVIRYSKETKEVILLNWHKYNWNSSEKFRKPLKADIDEIKNNLYREYLSNIFTGNDKGYPIDTVSIPYPMEETDRGYPIDTTVTVTVTDTDTVSVTDTVSEKAKEVIDYLNQRTKSRYTYAKSTLKPIKGRLEDFTVEDCKEVIDKKIAEWKGTDMEKFIRPETLFAPSKFEAYLNQPWQRPKDDLTDHYAMMEEWASERERVCEDSGCNQDSVSEV